MKILMVDNYDSFTYNVVHMLESFDGVEVVVRRNDAVSVEEALGFQKIVLSPGPGLPAEAGAMPEIVRACASSRSILGVCLGHQCIGEIFGGELFNLSTPLHGKATPVRIVEPDEVLFKGLPEVITVGRYHSWVVKKDSFPADLQVTAVDGDGEVMALRHRVFDVRGVQFHPESILTETGRQMLENWVVHEKAA
jgi:anthranilate synthase component 2